jgi:ADP-ribose pyrophosphatase YjhB (NUDIX family)
MFRNPIPTVDIIIWDEQRSSVVLIERGNPPHGWALPGGFVDEGECLEDAAVREALEETGLKCELICLFYAYSDPARDARKHTISTVFVALGRGELKGGDDARQAQWYSLEALPELVFDHGEILRDFSDVFVHGNSRFHLRESWKNTLKD